MSDNDTEKALKKIQSNSLVVQWLGLSALTAGAPGSIPGQEIRSHNTQHGKKKKHPMMIKILSKFRLKENFLSLMKGILREPTAHSILNRERLKDFLQYSEQGEDVGFYSHFVNVGRWGSHLWNKEREIKGIWIGKEEITLSPFMDNMIVHMEKLRGSASPA